MSPFSFVATCTSLCLLWNRRFTLGWSGGGESAVVVWEPLLGESLRSSQHPVHGGAVGGGQGQHRRPFCVCFGLSPHPPPPSIPASDT